MPRMAIKVEEGGEGLEVDPGAEDNGEVLSFSSLVNSSCPSLLETTMFEVEAATEDAEEDEVEEAAEVLLLLSNSISRICSCRISSLESGIKYFLTCKNEEKWWISLLLVCTLLCLIWLRLSDSSKMFLIILTLCKKPRGNYLICIFSVQFCGGVCSFLVGSTNKHKGKHRTL